MDLSKFHKIETDDSCTTLEHESGHKLKIVHKSLSPDLKKKLDAIPVKMAKGGFAKHAQKYDPNMAQKASKASKPSDSTNTMPGSPTEAKNNYTEPNAIGTSMPPKQLKAELSGYAPASDITLNVMHSMEKKAPPFGPLGGETMHYPPCINPSCKSYGSSHPNCRCYGGNPEGKPHGEMQGHFAEGGEVDDETYCSANRVHKKKCEYFKMGGVALGDAPGEEPQEVQEAEVNPNPENGSAPAPAEVAPAADNMQPAQDAPAPEKPATETPQDPAQHAAEVQDRLMGDDAATQSDINAGHIQPETYHDLFGKKDTIGKIGTLFGLLVGGAGSGLTGQPNMVMDMMDKQIKNDLQAQETSAQNKQNLLKINQSNLANNAGVNMTKQQANSIALANTYMQQNRLALDSLVKTVQKLPPGSPQRAQAEQTLAILSQKIDAKNATIASQAGMASAMQGQMFGNGQGGGQNTQAMKAGFMGPEAARMGQDIEDKTIPGIPGQAKIPVPQEARNEIQAMKVLSDKAQDLINFSKQHVGTLDPKTRAVAQQKAEEMVNFYNNSIKGGVLTEGRLKWFDDQIKKNPTSLVTQLMGNNARLQEIKDSNDHRQGILLDQYGFPKQKSKSSGGSAPQNSGGGEIERMDPKSGKIVVYDSSTKKPLRYK